MKFTVVFILSTNYSGSHLLAQLLGSHSQCLSIGELHNFGKLRDRVRTDRDVVNDYATNPLFAGLSDCPPGDWHARIFANSRAYRPNVTTMIDASKRVAWAERCAAAGAFDAVYLHLLRDPRAIVRRWLATYGSRRARCSQRRRLLRQSASSIATAFGPFDRVLLRKWVLANAAISEFVATQRKTRLVLYDDVARRASATLTGLMPVLGLAFEPSQLEYGRVAHAGTLKRAYLGASARSLIAPDLRWRDELPVSVIERIERSRTAAEYLARIGVELTADGLRRSR